jgi:hypothetical protein
VPLNEIRSDVITAFEGVGTLSVVANYDANAESVGAPAIEGMLRDCTHPTFNQELMS